MLVDDIRIEFEEARNNSCIAMVSEACEERVHLFKPNGRSSGLFLNGKIHLYDYLYSN